MEMKVLDKSLQRSGSVNTVSQLNMRRSQYVYSLDGMASGSTAGRCPSTAANNLPKKYVHFRKWTYEYIEVDSPL
jgi:hypothetical protein